MTLREKIDDIIFNRPPDAAVNEIIDIIKEVYDDCQYEVDPEHWPYWIESRTFSDYIKNKTFAP